MKKNLISIILLIIVFICLCTQKEQTPAGGGGGAPSGGGSSTPSSCSDGTSYGQCSTNKPLYCSNGNLINNCSSCGCLSGKSCNTTSQQCYIPSVCSGTMSLNLIPSAVQPSGSVVPSASGLANCNNKAAYFRMNSCGGTQASSCIIMNGGCTGSSFTASSSEGLYTYYACIDKNSDGDFTDSGEYSLKILNVTKVTTTVEIRIEY